MSSKMKYRLINTAKLASGRVYDNYAIDIYSTSKMRWTTLISKYHSNDASAEKWFDEHIELLKAQDNPKVIKTVEI